MMNNQTLTAVIFNNLRILNSVTPQDTYLDNYLWHWKQQGDKFFDLYHLAFWWGCNHRPKKILEIGSRTGLSLAQLLSAYTDYTGVRVVLFDLWNDSLSTPDLIKKHLNYLGIHVPLIEFYQGDSKQTVPEFSLKNTDSFDWVLVDGDHSQEGARTDLNNVFPLISKGGVLVFDDLNEFDGIHLRPVWDEFKRLHENEFTWHLNTYGKGVGWAVRI